jgi:hypothetical protein
MADARTRLAGFIDSMAREVRDAVEHRTAATTKPPAADLRAIGVGWATVELDRARVELAADLRLGQEAFIQAADDPALGARCLATTADLGGGVGRLAIVIFEPSTEGRLAATLARSGEGPAAVWLETADLAATMAALRGAGIAVSAPRNGPLGSATLLLDGRLGGPNRFLVARAPGTIGR